MLDTVLQIGKTFRNSPDGLKYHRYVKSPTQQKDWEKITFLSLPVMKDFSFDFKGIKPITDENLKQKLHYITFKTSDQDGAIKYIYGDIYYGRNKNEKEFGNYRISISAFENGIKYLKDTQNDALISYIESFGKNIEEVHKVLLGGKNIFLHFDFNGKHWYENNIINEINKIIVENFTEKIIDENQSGLVFQKMLYRTLCSGDEKNDRQFPLFSNKNKHKAKLFSREDVVNLLYGINYTEKPTLTPYNFYVGRSSEKIKIIVLPREDEISQKLSAKDYEDYSVSREEVIKITREVKDNDWLFSSLLNNVKEEVIAFDVVFVKEGSRIDSDILEITGIEKSFIKELNDRINKIRSKCEQEYSKNFFIVDSFKNIFDDKSTSLKKYQNHLYKTLPKIYSGNYYEDLNLFQATIERIEYSIRNQDSEKILSINYRVNQLKNDFYFLTKIQNTLTEGENIMRILESQSYKLGLSLGKMAVPLKKEIKSFEKNYVGNLSRRISSLEDLIKFKTFIEEKLIIHDKAYPNIKEASLNLGNDVKFFNVRFDKNECAFGFFESYFAPFNEAEPEKSSNDNK